MKRITSIFLTLLLIAIMAVGAISCEGGVITPVPQPTGPVPGAEASSLIPTANNTFDIGSLTKQWNDAWFGGTMTAATAALTTVTVGGYTMTFPGSAQTLVGRTTTDTLTNKTLTAPTITGTVTIADFISTNATLTSPAINGTPVFSNHASGVSGNFTAGSATGVTITHGMASTPTRIYLTYAGDPGASPPALYPSSIGAATFTVSVSSNITNGVQVSWLAFIADE
jgi:hypothetical protein